MFAPPPTRVLVAAEVVTLAILGCAPAGRDPDGSSSGAPSGGASIGATGGTAEGGTLAVGGTGGTGGTVITPPEPTGGTGSCENLQCRQRVCPEGSETSVTGTVYAPNGTLPLYNALVYVPNAPLSPFPSGLACDRCGSLPAGRPVVSAVTDARGEFRLTNVPVGADVPVVIEVGKWRRTFVIPEVTACAETTLADPEATRLPRNRREGDMPRIAVTTGSCDNLVCLIEKLGIDPEEWGVAGDGKAVTFYRGKPLDFDPHKDDRFSGTLAGMSDASELWGDFDALSGYDVAIFSCECEEALENKGAAAYDAVTRYLAAGGRVFGTDYQYVWYQHATDPDWALATTVQGAAPDGAPVGDTTIRLDTSFPKGKALADWLSVIAPDGTYGEVVSSEVFDNFTAARSGVTQVWGNSGTLAEPSLEHPRFLTVNMPAGAPVAEQCGKAVHLDAHIAALSPSEFVHFPESCGNELANGEQVLAFFFFDLAACIQEDSKPVVPPPTAEPR